MVVRFGMGKYKGNGFVRCKAKANSKCAMWMPCPHVTEERYRRDSVSDSVACSNRIVAEKAQ